MVKRQNKEPDKQPKKNWKSSYATVNSIRLRAVTNAIKVFQGCFNCGYDEHAQALDFHHIDPAKKEFAISSFVPDQYTDDTVLFDEMSKCVVLCRNCHTIIHLFGYDTHKESKQYCKVQGGWGYID